MSNTFVLAARLRATKLRGIYVHVDHLTAEAADALTAQAATIAEQARELEALVADAERYRYLRSLPDEVPQIGLDVATWENCSGKSVRLEALDAAIDAAMQSGKAAEPDATKCRKCNGNMRPGTYLEQTFSGVPDFPGDTHAVTVSPSGPGRLAECLKCDACGHSVTAGKAVQG